MFRFRIEVRAVKSDWKSSAGSSRDRSGGRDVRVGSVYSSGAMGWHVVATTDCRACGGVGLGVIANNLINLGRCLAWQTT
jgi:hypothetical protein